jgi:hypothetical protein
MHQPAASRSKVPSRGQLRPFDQSELESRKYLAQGLPYIRDSDLHTRLLLEGKALEHAPTRDTEQKCRDDQSMR